MTRAIILVLDSFGIGATEDAEKFGDTGADTLGHIAEECAAGRANVEREGNLKLPNLTAMGLLHAHKGSTGKCADGMAEAPATAGAYAYAAELSSGKDTPSGHWEMTGVPVLFEWGYFQDKTNSFPQELLDQLIREAGLPGVLGNCHSSGTTIIEEFGEEHMRTGKPIVYTSADSVFQIACHEETYGLDNLYKLCEIARGLLDDYNIGRVIARPFIGRSPDDFARTGNRKDYSVLPPAPTLLDRMKEKGGQVVSVGKIADIFANQGITKKVKATGFNALFDATLAEVDAAGDNTIVFTNFVDFDSAWGHRRDVPGYAAGLEEFDARLPELVEKLQPGDLLVLTADHGCDPTWHGSDHTREHVPVIFAGPGVNAVDLGKRDTFADLGQTLAEHFDLPKLEYGTSFLKQITA
ncbi:phosphopentomutase [Parendozoicomonas haliclonae]|uniref:Phosphopentomutase n=1 Tax=Parendozoicomonas haliclonae TaxID=1960125 RepID=A0A1X7APK9_9GAMM|nr:phosphopentomutase [Parendozoicomonas haliclonae]SMA50052.1 Phosphopentomutase [Parendozoicomonas haliclonae]